MSRYAATALISLMIATSSAERSAAEQATISPKQIENQHASPMHAVNIRFVLGYGYGCECYCGAEMQVRPGKATLRKRPTQRCQHMDSQKYRVLSVNADLSSKRWRELEQLVNHDALFALPDTIPCGCTGDEGDHLIEVEFSDHTKKSVRYVLAPNEITTLSEKLLALESKLENELPPWWGK